MKNYVENIRNLFLNLNSEEKKFMGKIPFSKNIEKQLNNHELVLQKGLTKRQRTNLGRIYLKNNKIIGYTSFTVLQNAIPTNYEKEFIDLNENLNYLQFKQLIVDSDFRGKGVETELIKYKLNLAKEFEKNSICDVELENSKMIRLLRENDFEEYFNWETPKGIEMIRFFHE